MLIKVCGITTEENVRQISTLPVDLVGLNFYAPSPRYIGEQRIKKPSDVKFVGIFVKASLSFIRQSCKDYKLDLVQLHGDENIEFCQQVIDFTPVIKVFRVDNEFDFSATERFDFCNYYLFDTKTSSFGGSGKRFNWDLLDKYRGNVPFIVGGGIGPDSIKDIKAISHPKFTGIDLNSRFELEPGHKDPELISSFIYRLKSDYHEVQR